MPNRPIIGATVGYLIGNQTSSLDGALLAASGGVTALASHLVKAGIRVGVNASPEPVSNIVLSSAEDASVAGVVALGAANPLLAAAVAALLLIAGLVLAVVLLRRLARLKRSYDSWGQRLLGRPSTPATDVATSPPADPRRL